MEIIKAINRLTMYPRVGVALKQKNAIAEIGKNQFCFRLGMIFDLNLVIAFSSNLCLIVVK